MVRDWFKHAFAIESDSTAAPSQPEQALADRLCRQVVARELTTPALIFLETIRPLNFITAQSIQFFAPLLSVLGDPHAIDHFTAFLSRRGSIDWLCRRIGELERERSAGNAAAEGQSAANCGPD